MVNGDQRLAQTFSASARGTITAAQIRITKNAPDGPGDYLFQLMGVEGEFGNPGQPVDGVAFTGGSVPEAAVPDGAVNLPTTVTFTRPLAVVAGQGLALMVTRPGSGANGLRVNTQPGTTCPGSLYNSIVSSGPFTDFGIDMAFTTFLDPPANSKIRKRPRRRSRKDIAHFKFSASEPNSTFRCSLDQRKPTKCRSPKTYRGLEDGKHFFTVQAVDSVGNFGPRPASFTWWVKTRD